MPIKSDKFLVMCTWIPVIPHGRQVSQWSFSGQSVVSQWSVGSLVKALVNDELCITQIQPELTDNNDYITLSLSLSPPQHTAMRTIISATLVATLCGKRCLSITSMP